MAQLTLVLLQLNMHKKDTDKETKQEVQMLKLHSCLFTAYPIHTAVFAALLCSPKIRNLHCLQIVCPPPQKNIVSADVLSVETDFYFSETEF